MENIESVQTFSVKNLVFLRNVISFGNVTGYGVKTGAGFSPEFWFCLINN